MHIEHIAVWVEDLEGMRAFYEEYFDATSNDRYENPKKSFSSYFLTLPGEGARVELMHFPEVPVNPFRDNLSTVPGEQFTGFIHFALSLGSKEAVLSLTERLRADGHKVIGEPRTTGDGYFESVVLDPEGNMIELTE